MNKKFLKLGVILFFVVASIIGLIVVISINAGNKEVDTMPYMLQEGCQILESDIQKGMVIKDTYGNEWVWIPVPKTTVFITAKNSDDYINIEKDIKEYTKNYRELKYNDDALEYKDLKEKTLKSIYTYGGFWVSRYEIGNTEIRKYEDLIDAEPLSQPNKYVYNFVTFQQAQELASKISNGEYESNLMFGFQWDLICKFIEKNGYMSNGEKITEAMINRNSSNWGNYYTATFTINNGEYSTDYGKEYKKVEKDETKTQYKYYLLTTGASEENRVCNLYDFAGNVTEWTLEETIVAKKVWKTIRDGNFYFNYGGNDPVSGRYMVTDTSSKASYGFRVCCIK